MINRRLKKIIEFSLLLKKQILYLVDFETDIIIKSTPEGPYFRRINGKEFEIFWENDVVFRAVNGQRRTTKKEYENS